MCFISILNVDLTIPLGRVMRAQPSDFDKFIFSLKVSCGIISDSYVHNKDRGYVLEHFTLRLHQGSRFLISDFRAYSISGIDPVFVCLPEVLFLHFFLFSISFAHKPL